MMQHRKQPRAPYLKNYENILQNNLFYEILPNTGHSFHDRVHRCVYGQEFIEFVFKSAVSSETHSGIIGNPVSDVSLVIRGRGMGNHILD
jgi:hypothetical protein